MVNISRVMGKQYKNIMIDGSLSFADICLTQEGYRSARNCIRADQYVRLSYAVSIDKIKIA